MQGRPAGRVGGGAGMRRRTAGNVERGRRTVRPGDEAAAAATWAAGVGVGMGALESAWGRSRRAGVGVAHRGPQSTTTTEGAARPRRRERGHGRGPLDEGDRRRGPREGVGGGAQRGGCRPGRRTIGEAVERRRQSRGGEEVEEEEQGF